MDSAELINAVSAWIDNSPTNKTADPQARTWARIGKVAEECGEVIAAYIGATGQNPRKGYTHTIADVETELLDVALTALAAWAHLRENKENSILALITHIAHRSARAGIS